MDRHSPLDQSLRLQRLINPRSIVFVGGSVIKDSVDYCRKNNFRGEIYVVNPFHSTIAGITCLASIDDLPAVPDSAFLAVSKDTVCENLMMLHQLGVGGVVCNSSGFSEIEGKGFNLQAEFIAAAGDMPVVGPNCPGIANFLDGNVQMMGHFGDHQPQSGVAVISNGGAYLSDMGCADRSLPVAYLFGMGNQATLSVTDIFDAVLEDNRVTAINLYIESLCDVPGLSAAALKAARRRIPVVVVKGGRSSAGRRATQTHTASLAGDSVIASALFERLGFVEAQDTEDATETLKMLLFSERKGQRGRKLGLATSSGSYAVMAGDAAEEAGLRIPAPNQKISVEIEKLLPDYIRAANPLDISTAQYYQLDDQRKIFRQFLSQELDIAALVMCFPPSVGWDDQSWYVTTEAFAKEAVDSGIPAAFVSTLSESLPKQARQKMIENGIAPLLGIHHGIRAIANSAIYSEQMEWLSGLPDENILVPQLREAGDSVVEEMDEATAKAMLLNSGIAVPASARLDSTGTQDVAALSYPVALKILSPGLLHKTEIGGVVLNLKSVDEVRLAADAMQQHLKEIMPELIIRDFLVEEMVQDGIAELMVGIRRVEGIGLAATIAFGGSTVELTPDLVTIILPASRSGIERALRQLKQFPLLTGWRGKPGADLDAIVASIDSLCTFALTHSDRLVDLEVNPLIVSTETTSPIVADAVLRMTKN